MAPISMGSPRAVPVPWHSPTCTCGDREMGEKWWVEASEIMRNRDLPTENADLNMI